MNDLLRFELACYFRKPASYIILLCVFGLGFFIGIKQLSLNAGPEIYKNAPYSVATMIGFLSLAGIFTTTLIGTQILFKETDAYFIQILYATPITSKQYITGRFIAVFAISLILLLITVCGYGFGQLLDSDQAVYGPFRFWAYLQPILLLTIPNLLLCATLICGMAWLTKNKLMVYLLGLLFYITYTILLLYSGSPLMAGTLPQSPTALEISARIDPFGLSAFYQQTNAWTLTQKNTQMTTFTGNLLLNRITYIALSISLLFITYKTFSLYINRKHQRKNDSTLTKEKVADNSIYHSVSTSPEGLKYLIQASNSFIKLDLNFAIRSLPVGLITIALTFFMSMDFYGAIDQGIRLPEQYASTSLMVNRIIYNLPGILLLIILFYTHELYWRSINSRINLIEYSTPIDNATSFIAKWISLSVLVLILLTLTIAAGIIFQIIYQYIEIKWLVYLSLYWLLGIPMIVCTGIALGIQKAVGHKWLGLLISTAALLVLATSLGKTLGLVHPLIRFATAYTGKYSEMNGWGAYLPAFSWKLFFGCSITLLFLITVFYLKNKRQNKIQLMAVIILLICSLTSAFHIQKQLSRTNVQGIMDDQQAYELQYRRFALIPQPTITSIRTEIELYPKSNSYHVNGVYRLVNNTNEPIKRILLTFDDTTILEQACYFSEQEKIDVRQKVGFITLKNALAPGSKASFQFSFSYQWDGFTGHRSFNAIVQNGSFIRLSNYFPRFGYQPDHEITNLTERKKRHLGNQTPLTELEAPRGKADNFITLDMTLGTNLNQTAVGIGELTRQWHKNGRSYFHYQTSSPIPFRFAVSSASYHIQKLNHKGIAIEVYYTPKHFQNVSHLINTAEKALEYCQNNFSVYPFKTIRFAEVSAFTEGFAGTAYPATIFMTEDMIFHANLKGDNEQDVINELAGHELSHQWWGANQLVPDDREGAKLLTETLAMYTELMLVKHNLGKQRVLENVAVHKDIYQNEKGFSKETPLYKVRPEAIHLHYSKGLVVMYRLTELIGEENVNKALRNLLKKHIYPGPTPISTDLLNELYLVSPLEVHQQISSLFKQIEPL